MLKKIIHDFILSRRKEIPFIIFFAFLITFVIARAAAYSIHYNVVPEFLFFVKTVYIKGYHIHHFNFGIILLAIAGFLSLIDSLRSHIRKIAILYGIGLALIMDEFGILVTFEKDFYWTRRSFDAVILTALILLNIVFFGRFWKVMGGKIKKVFKRN